VAERNGVCRSQLYAWLRQARDARLPGILLSPPAADAFVPVNIDPAIRRTKGKRDRVAPLIEETGAALADYILRARPMVDSAYLFLSFYAPRVCDAAGSNSVASVVPISCVTAWPPSLLTNEDRSTRSPLFSGIAASIRRRHT
jgi:hypothetical protein